MVASTQCGVSTSSIELFIRSATVLPRHPAVLVMDASPDQNYCNNGHLPRVNKISAG